jgi:hypothetical protein
MIILLIERRGLPAWFKVSLVILSLVAAFILGQSWAELDAVESVSEILLA